MPSFNIDFSGRNGLTDRTASGSNNEYSARPGQMTSGIWNPFIRRGYMSPIDDTETDVTATSPSASVGSVVYDSENDDFYMGVLDKELYKGDTLDDTTLGSAAVDLGASALIRDLEIYQVNAVKKIFVMYTDSSNNAEIAISSLPYDTGTDDLTWLTTTVSGSFSNSSTGDIFLVPADNGFAYLFMENQVHKIDGTSGGGTNGTATANVVVFPVGWRVHDAVDFRGSIYMGVHLYDSHLRSTTATVPPDGATSTGIYVWDRISSEVSTSDFIPLPGIQVISKLFVTSAGSLGFIGIDSAGLTVIKEWTGTKFKTVKVVGYDMHPVLRDSVSAFGDFVMWTGKLGDIFLWGKHEENNNDSLFQIASVAAHSTDSAGTLLTKPGTTTDSPAYYHTYYSSSNAVEIKRTEFPFVKGHTGTVAVDAGDVRTPVFYLPGLSTVRNIQFFVSRESGGGSTEMGTVAVHINNNSSAFKTFSVTQDELSRGYFSIELNKPYVNSIQLLVNFDTTSQAKVDNFCPAFATVNFEPTRTRG